MPESLTVIPSFRYNDADAAMEWLEKALGFTQHAVYRHPGAGYVMHAEMVLRRKNGGIGMVMLGSNQNQTEMSALSVDPRQAGGVTGSAYVVVDDCEPVFAAAQRAGAEVLSALRTMDYGGKAFSLRDPEGQIWAVGEYDPFALLEV